jgi:hypothetical protein
MRRLKMGELGSMTLALLLLAARLAWQWQHACRSFVRDAAAHPVRSGGLLSKAHA